MIKVHLFAFAFAFAFAMVAHAYPQAPAAGAPDEIDGTIGNDGVITITNLTTSGPGCPQGSVEISSSPITQQIDVGQLNDFRATLSPTSDQKDQSRNCNIMAQVNFPVGMKFTIEPGPFEGTATLDAGVVGHFSQTFFFSGAAQVIVSSN